MYRIIFYFILFISLAVNARAQVFRYRIGTNANSLIREIGANENIYSGNNGLPATEATPFANKYNFGFETELIRPWTNNLEAGIEIEYSRFSGSNDNPTGFNYFFTDPFQVKHPDFNGQPVEYGSSTINFLANLKYFISLTPSIQPFAKIYLGSSLVGSELSYKNTGNLGSGVLPLLYASGTKNSEISKKAAFQYGAGLGLNFKFSEKFSLYFDGNVSVINSNTLDGVPNFNYALLNGSPFFSANASKSMVSQFSFGLVFTTLKFDFSNINLDISVPQKTKTPKKPNHKRRSKGKISKYFPFFREKF